MLTMQGRKFGGRLSGCVRNFWNRVRATAMISLSPNSPSKLMTLLRNKVSVAGSPAWDPTPTAAVVDGPSESPTRGRQRGPAGPVGGHQGHQDARAHPARWR